MAREKKAFVIISADPKYRDVFHSICRAFNEKKYTCEKIDDEPRQIIESIINADIMVVDISENSPNIFYELGICHSIGNKTITIISEESHIPSEIIPFPAIRYTNDSKGRNLLFYRLKDSIEELKRAKEEFDRTKLMKPNNIVQEVGQYYFDQRIKIEEKLENLNNEIDRATKFKEFIEDDFPDVDNSKVAEKIVSHIKRVLYKNTTVIVSICGSGAVGKSSFARSLQKCIEQTLNVSVAILPTDSYMLSRADRIQKNLIGFDRKANDLDKFYQDVKKLVNGNEISVRPYSHKTGEHKKETTIYPSDIIILEGIYSFNYPELKNAEKVRQLKYFIYADKLKAKELKFISDIKERGHNIYTALQHAVPEYSAYETHILPFIKQADYIIKVDEYWRYSFPDFQD